MKRFIHAPLALLLLLGALQQASADEAPPRTVIAATPTAAVKLVVQVDNEVKEAHLRIPRGLLPGAAKTEKGAETGAFALPTVVAGLALTLAFVSGGFWLVRRGRGPGRAVAAAILALSLLCLGGSMVWADLPIGPRPKPPVPRPALTLPAGVQLSENLVLDIVETGDAVTLVVNKNMVLKTDKPEDK